MFFSNWSVIGLCCNSGSLLHILLIRKVHKYDDDLFAAAHHSTRVKFMRLKNETVTGAAVLLSFNPESYGTAFYTQQPGGRRYP